jgi:hypothetical protein
MKPSEITIGRVIIDSSGKEYRIVGIDYWPPRLGASVVLDPLVKTGKGVEYKHVKISDLDKYEVTE